MFDLKAKTIINDAQDFNNARAYTIFGMKIIIQNNCVHGTIRGDAWIR